MAAKKKPAPDKATLQTLSDRLIDLEEKIDRLIHNVQGIRVVEADDDEEEDCESSNETETRWVIKHDNGKLKLKINDPYFAGSTHGEDGKWDENWVNDLNYAYKFKKEEDAHACIKYDLDEPEPKGTKHEIVKVTRTYIEGEGWFDWQEVDDDE